MASGYSEWTSPRQQKSPPKRQRVQDLRDKFEALSDNSGSRKQGSSQGSSKERNYGSGAAHQKSKRSSQTYWPSTEYSDSLHDEAFRHGPSYRSEYYDSIEEQDQPSFSNVLESTRIDGREGRQPSGDAEPTGMEPEGFQDISAPRGHADPGPSGAYPTQPSKEFSTDEEYYHKWYLDNQEKVKDYDHLYSVVTRLLETCVDEFSAEDHHSGIELGKLLEFLVESLCSLLPGRLDELCPVSSPGSEEEMEDSVFLPDDPEADRSMKKYLKQLKYRHILPTFGSDEDSVDYYDIRHYTTEPYLLDAMEHNFYNPPQSQPYSERPRYYQHSTESSGGTQRPANLNETFTIGPDEERHSAPSSNRSYSNQAEDMHSTRSMGRRGQQANLNETFTRPDEGRQSAPSSNRSMGRRGQQANLNETFTRRPDEGRQSAPSSNRSYSNQEEDIHSTRSMGRRGQQANLNETFIRPDEGRQSAPSSNRSYSNQEDIQSPRSRNSIGRTEQPENLNETFFYANSPQQLNRSHSSQQNENIHTTRTESESQPQDLNRRLGSEDFNLSDLSYDSHASSPRRSKNSSGYQASSPHSSDSSHGPPRPQLRRRRRAQPNIYDPNSTSSASDAPRRPNLNEAQHSSGQMSMTNDGWSRRRHTSDPHSTQSSLTSRSSAPRDLDDQELAATNRMESGSDEPGSDEPGRRGAGYFVSDIEERLGTRKLEPKPNTSNARWEAFQDQLREINREAAQSWSDSYSDTEHTHSSEQEHSHPSQEQDDSADDVPEDANETGSYRAPSPNMLGRQWAQGDLNEMLRRMHASDEEHGSRRGSPENVHEQNGDRRVSPQQAFNRRWGPGDFAAQLERMHETRVSAQQSRRSNSSQEGAHSPGSQSRTSSSTGRNGQPVNLNETFIRPDEERHSAPSSNGPYSNQEDIHSSRSNRSMGREQPANINETFFYANSPQQLNRSYSRQEENIPSPRTESEIQPQDLNRRLGSDDFNEQSESRSSANGGWDFAEQFARMQAGIHQNRSYSQSDQSHMHSPQHRTQDDIHSSRNADDFNQQPGPSNATSEWDEGCF